MKKLFILLLLVIAAPNIYAQKASGESWGKSGGPSKKEESPARVVNVNASPMDYMSMDVQDNMLVLDNIPNINSMTLHVTNSAGDEKITKKLGVKNHSIDIASLPKGLYFVTITSDNSDNRKSFTFSKD